LPEGWSEEIIRERLGQHGIQDALNGFLVLVIRGQEGHLVLQEEFACLAERPILAGRTLEDGALRLDEDLRATTRGI
jgi:hypothetical protein